MNSIPPNSNRRTDRLCIIALLVITMAAYAPALFGGKVMLPADIVPLMRPWAVTAREKFPDYKSAQNQLHGPIFEYYSWRHYARERLLAGEVPLWNPYEMGGNVLLANSQSAVLYPPNFLLYLFPLWYGINLVTALHTFLTGFFLFGLLRLLKLHPVAAFSGALAWMFCGLQMVWMEFQTPTAALCWLPGLIWAWETFCQRDNRRLLFITGSSGIALTLLAGHLQFAFYSLLAFVIYAGWRTLFSENRSVQKMGRGFATLGITLSLGFLLAMATLLPVMEMARMNHRSGKTNYESSIGLRMPPVHLLTLIQPNVFGNPRDYYSLDSRGNLANGNSYFGPFDFIEFTGYPGIAVLIFAISAVPVVILGLKSRKTLVPGSFLLIAALGIMMALGTPICALFFYAVPGYGQFNATARSLCLFNFGIAVMAAYGIHALVGMVSEKANPLRNLVITTSIVMILGLGAFPGLGLTYSQMLRDDWWGYELHNLGHMVLFTVLTLALGGVIVRQLKSGASGKVAWLIPVVITADLMALFLPFNPVTNPQMLGYPTGTTDFLASTGSARTVSLEEPGKGIKGFIVPNYNSVIHSRDVQGADSLHLKRVHKLMERLVLAMDRSKGSAFSEPNTIHVPNVNHSMFDVLNVKYITTVPSVACPDKTRLTSVLDAELHIWENKKALGPAWIVGRAEIAASLDEFWSKFNAPDFNPRQTALTEASIDGLESGAANSTVTETLFEPHRLKYDLDVKGQGLLVISEISFPGWSATVDGKSVELITADHILRALKVKPGNQTVSVIYEPNSYRLGMYLSCITLASLFGIALSKRGKRQPII